MDNTYEDTNRKSYCSSIGVLWRNLFEPVLMLDSSLFGEKGYGGGSANLKMFVFNFFLNPTILSIHIFFQFIFGRWTHEDDNIIH